MSSHNIQVFKFGGASVKSAYAIKNLAQILRDQHGALVIVISAIGKTTNALEKVLEAYINGAPQLWEEFYSVKHYHIDIVSQLFPENNNFNIEINELFSQMETLLKKPALGDYNFCYDQFVSYGEILSTRIISCYLNTVGIKNRWVDARSIIRTDDNYREGNVIYGLSRSICQSSLSFDNQRMYITQGFIGGTEGGYTTTLGREGSDYTAALLANLLDARDVTIWKDVQGVLNADPRIFEKTTKLKEVSFKEAIELAYCGAQIIHPKTIKPLQNKQISLYVKSFLNPEADGTLVYQTEKKISYPPILILKRKQVLISLSPKDFSFVIEDCLSKIFATLYSHRVKANIIQSSAISFSICVDDEEHFLPSAINELKDSFTVKYNRGLDLLTIRHYSKEEVDKQTQGRKVLLEQKTRSTIRVVME
ncbi:MAG: aspartate kinase [Bacteroidales bacterium]